MKNKILSLILAVLCVMTAIPFTVLPVAYAEGEEVHIFNGSQFANLERPWGGNDLVYTTEFGDFNEDGDMEDDGEFHKSASQSQANYTIYGYMFDQVSNPLDANDPIKLTKVYRDPSVETPYSARIKYTTYKLPDQVQGGDGQMYDVYGYRLSTAEDAGPDDKLITIGGNTGIEQQGTKDFNLYMYKTVRDKDGKTVPRSSRKYVTLEYYIDTTGRANVEDSDFDDFSAITNSQFTDFGSNANQTAASGFDTTQNNQWKLLTYDASEKTALDSTEDVGQIKWYLFGQNQFDMHKGDVLYIRRVIMSSFDPFDGEVTIPVSFVDEYTWNNLSATLPTVNVNKVSYFAFPELPAGIDAPSADAVFAGWKDLNSSENTLYKVGDVFEVGYTAAEYVFAPAFEVPNTLTFKYTEALSESFTQKAFSGESIVMPAHPAAGVPAGKFFKGWSDGENTYAPGSTYVVQDEDTNLEAVYSDLSVFYYSSTGSIDGIADTVYASFSEIVTAAKFLGGVKVVVDGSLDLGSGNWDFTNITELTITGYDSEAKVMFCKEGDRQYKGSNTDLIFDNIILSRHDSSWNEQAIILLDVNMHIKETCKYQTNNNGYGLYIGHNGSFTAGYGFRCDANFPIAQLSSSTGWQSHGRSTGDFNIEINNGTVTDLFLVDRNGHKDSTGYSQITGNINVTIGAMNIGGTMHNPVIKTLGYSQRTDVLEGNGILTINGGKIEELYLSSADTYTGRATTTSGNVAFIINTNDIIANGGVVPTSIRDIGTVTFDNAVLLINNSESYSATIPAPASATHIISVNGGKGAPVFSGKSVKFTFTPDDPADNCVFVNGVQITPSEGMYTIEKSEDVVNVVLAPEGTQFNKVTVNYVNDELTDEEYDGGATYTFPTAPAKPTGEVIYAWTVEGDSKFYSAGDKINLPDETKTINVTGIWVNPVNATIYVDFDNGNDASDGLTNTTAFASFSAVSNKLGLFGANDVTVKVLSSYTNSKGNLTFPNSAAYTGTLTVSGVNKDETIFSVHTGYEVMENLVLENITLAIDQASKHINLNGYNFEVKDSAEGYGVAGIHFQKTGSVGASYTANQKVVIDAPGFGSMYMGLSYIGNRYYTDPAANVWTGDLDLTIGSNATISTLSYGDSWGSPTGEGEQGKFTHVGNINVTFEEGSAFIDSKTKAVLKEAVLGLNNCGVPGNVVVHNDGATNINVTNVSTATVINYNEVKYLSNDGTNITVEGEGSIVETGANTASGVVAMPTSAGIYNFRAGKSIASSDLAILGVEIRFEEGSTKQALRFKAKMSADAKATIGEKEHGFVLIPNELIGTDTYVSATKIYDGDMAPEVIASARYFTADEDIYTLAITDIGETNYATKYTAVAYYKDGETYIYGDQYTVSLYDAAVEALRLASLDPSDAEYAEKYLLDTAQTETLTAIKNAVEAA